MASDMENSPDTYTFVPNNNKDDHYDPSTKTITIDPNFNPPVMTFHGKVPASVPAVLGHEMGHATGTGDTGPNRMDNVRKNENPVRQGLKEDIRIQY